MQNETAMALYETVADDVSTMIRAGTLSPGARVPSVRRMSQQRRVSISTVLQAYHELENRGVLEARPQSGYYVRVPLITAKEPTLTKPPRSPQFVGVDALVSRVLEVSGKADVISLGAAIPDFRFIPSIQLGRAVAAVSYDQKLCMT